MIIIHLMEHVVGKQEGKEIHCTSSANHQQTRRIFLFIVVPFYLGTLALNSTWTSSTQLPPKTSPGCTAVFRARFFQVASLQEGTSEAALSACGLFTLGVFKGGHSFMM